MGSGTTLQEQTPCSFKEASQSWHLSGRLLAQVMAGKQHISFPALHVGIEAHPRPSQLIPYCLALHFTLTLLVHALVHLCASCKYRSQAPSLRHGQTENCSRGSATC